VVRVGIGVLRKKGEELVSLESVEPAFEIELPVFVHEVRIITTQERNLKRYLFDRELIIDSAYNVGPFLTDGVGDNGVFTSDQFSLVGFVTRDDSPSREDEGNRTVCSHPLPVVFSGEMQMCTGGHPTFTRGMPDSIIDLQPGALFHSTIGGNVQIQQIPASLFITIAIEINHDDTVF